MITGLWRHLLYFLYSIAANCSMERNYSSINTCCALDSDLAATFLNPGSSKYISSCCCCCSPKSESFRGQSLNTVYTNSQDSFISIGSPEPRLWQISKSLPGLRHAFSQLLNITTFKRGFKPAWTTMTSKHLINLPDSTLQKIYMHNLSKAISPGPCRHRWRKYLSRDLEISGSNLYKQTH